MLENTSSVFQGRTKSLSQKASFLSDFVHLSMVACCKRITDLLCQGGHPSPCSLIKLVEKTGLARSSIMMHLEHLQGQSLVVEEEISHGSVGIPKTLYKPSPGCWNKGFRLYRTKFVISGWALRTTRRSGVLLPRLSMKTANRISFNQASLHPSGHCYLFTTSV